MSYVRVGDEIINLMSVSLVVYQVGENSGSSVLAITLIGVQEPRVYIGDEADMIWSKFRKMATPLDKV